MRILGLDLSKNCTGYACWGEDDERVKFGSWCLGSEFTPEGLVYANVHGRLTELHDELPFDAIFFEEKLDPRALHGHTNMAALNLMSGLRAHVLSWAHQMQISPVVPVNQSKWRRTFLGPYPRTTKRDQLKAMAMERAKGLGFFVAVHDEAEGIGILTHGCLALKIQPYWLADEVLRPELNIPSRGRVR